MHCKKKRNIAQYVSHVPFSFLVCIKNNSSKRKT